jgi:hypothetical protein
MPCREIAFPSNCLHEALGVVLVSCISLSVLVKAHADVDPAMAGTWETSGVNEHGPWKLTWEIQADSSYFLSGALSDSGMIGSGDGRWHTLSNVTKQSADGTYTMSDADRMLGTGPLGSAAWTRVPGKAPKTSSGPARLRRPLLTGIRSQTLSPNPRLLLPRFRRRRRQNWFSIRPMPLVIKIPGTAWRRRREAESQWHRNYLGSNWTKKRTYRS